MDKGLKNIPKQFLINTSFSNNYNTNFGVSSIQIKEIKEKNIQNSNYDNIWLLIILLIILDII